MTTARDHSFVSDAPRFDFGGLAFGDRAGGASHLSRFASQPYGRSSTGPRCDYCGAPSCACEDRFTFEYLTDGDRA